MRRAAGLVTGPHSHPRRILIKCDCHCHLKKTSLNAHNNHKLISAPQNHLHIEIFEVRIRISEFFISCLIELPYVCSLFDQIAHSRHAPNPLSERTKSSPLPINAEQCAKPLPSIAFVWCSGCTFALGCILGNLPSDDWFRSPKKSQED